VADLGEEPGPPLFWVTKEEMTEGRKAGRASKTNTFLRPIYSFFSQYESKCSAEET